MYEPHTWVTGEIVTADKLNHIEDGIQQNAFETNLASEFSTDLAYTTGQYVVNYGVLYKFISDKAAGEWDASKVTEITVGAELKDITDDAFDPGNIASEFSTASAYTTGAYVIYNGDLYRFTADKAAGEWDSTKVVAVVLCDDVANKANTDGSYADMTVGMAENLVSSVGIDDKTPYNFRTSGGSVDIGGRERVDAVVGVTVAWNQLVQSNLIASKTQYEVVGTNNGDGSYTVNGTANGGSFDAYGNLYFTKNHVYYIVGCPANGSNDTYYLYSQGQKDFGNGVVFKRATATSTSSIDVVVKSGAAVNNLVFRPQIFDLTAMFGSTIADYIYALEQSNAGAGVAYFRKLFPNPYYGYSAPTLLSVKTSAHKMVGFNAYDNSEGKAKVVGGNVYQITGTYTALTLNGSTITPDASGYFTPSENGEITVTGGNATDTCIHLKWDGERDGEYEAYQEWTYALDSDLELRGTPKLDANNKLYYDGDTYAPDGTVTRNYEYRAYASGDESLADAITDGTHTVAKLVTPTTESADEYQQTQNVSDWGTEEYVDSRAVPIPVGHNTFYQANLKAKLEMAPDSPSDGDGLYVVQQISGENTYVPLVVPNEIPDAPTTDGTYVLKATVSGGTATYSWVSE